MNSTTLLRPKRLGIPSSNKALQNNILPFLDNPFLRFRPCKVAPVTYVRRFLKGGLVQLEWLDKAFGRVFGAYVLLGAATEVLFGSAFGMETRHFIDRYAAWLAAGLFILFALRVAFRSHAALTLNDAIHALCRNLQRRVRRSGQYRKHRATMMGVIAFSHIPVRWREQVIRDVAALAFNRWTENATLAAREQFFTLLTQKMGEEFWVGIECDPDENEASVCGYAGLVALGIPECRAHINGKVNLFEQGEEFFMSYTEVERIAGTNGGGGNSCSTSDKFGIYILGMNVRGGLPRDYGDVLMSQLKSRIRTLLKRWPERKPHLYCATAIPYVLKMIHRLGFIHRGNFDIQGNKLFERD